MAHVYDTAGRAAGAFAASNSTFERWVGQGGLGDSRIVDREEAPALDLGEEAVAERFALSRVEFGSSHAAHLLAFGGRVVHRWLALGGDPDDELWDLAEQHMAFALEGDDDEDAFALLPDLRDMPPMHTVFEGSRWDMTDEDVRRAKPTP